jgi:hypothetical protein
VTSSAGVILKFLGEFFFLVCVTNIKVVSTICCSILLETNSMDGSSATSQQTLMDYFRIPSNPSGWLPQQHFASYSPFSRYLWSAAAGDGYPALELIPSAAATEKPPVFILNLNFFFKQ